MAAQTTDNSTVWSATCSGKQPKKSQDLFLLGLYEKNPLVIEFPLPRATNAESVRVSRRRYVNPLVGL